MTPKYFPQGIAVDETFCNREEERANLKASIEAHEHIVMVAPRRYGKTSLIAQALKESKHPNINIDFFFVLTQTEVNRSIEAGVSKIVSELLPKTKAACNKLINTIRNYNPKLSINILGQKVEISAPQKSEISISELLMALDKVAEKVRKTCVVVFDEFQQVGQLKENHAIEASIRHAVERSMNTSYIFCGSNRHLLNEMFSDKSRPLYHLCDLMTIGRISNESYYKFLNKMAKKKWRQLLDTDVIHEIVHLTENHSYHLNALCRRLWRDSKVPSISYVRNTWDRYVNKQRGWIETDLSRLTLNRRKILTALAYEATNEPLGQHFSKNVGLAPSGINRGLIDLQKLDMVNKDEKGYFHVLDPVISYYIRKNGIFI